MSRNRNWVFTLNCSVEEDKIRWRCPGIPCPLGKWMDDGKILYLVCQVEEVGHLHIQGYCQFANPIGLPGLKKICPEAHWEVRRGTHEQARDYAMKAESRVNGPWTLGHEKNEQGKRNDWAAVAEKAKQGCTRKQILLDAPHLAPFVKGVDALIEASLPEPPLQRPLEVWYLWGPSDQGKTHRAFTAFPQAYKIKGKYFEGKSFDGYSGQKVLILDEWRPDEWPMTLMNDLLDKWECTLQCRYYNKTAYWEKVVICTNFKPDECYPADVMRRGTFLRRLTHIIEIKTRDDPVVDFGLGAAAASTAPVQPFMDPNGSPICYDADAWDDPPATQPLSPTVPWPVDKPEKEKEHPIASCRSPSPCDPDLIIDE